MAPAMESKAIVFDTCYTMVSTQTMDCTSKTGVSTLVRFGFIIGEDGGGGKRAR